MAEASIHSSFGHDLAHGFGALEDTLDEVDSLLNLPFSSLTDVNWHELRTLCDTVRLEIDAQRYQALNYLQAIHPELIGSLEKAQIEKISPVELLAGMLASYQLRASEYQIALTLARPQESMPPIWLDIAAVRQAFHNVLSNALKYSYKGAESRHRFIRIWARLHDPRHRAWAISFENYGIGISPGELHRVAEQGFRGTLAKREHTMGAGLGLSQVSACMRRHGGEFRFFSKVIHDETYLTTITLVFPERNRVMDR